MAENIKELLDSCLVDIPAGKIHLRDDRKKTRWLAKIDAFKLAKTPVTQALYQEVMQHNPSTFIANNNPVESVSWFDALKFCNALSIRQGLAEVYTLDEKNFTARLIAEAHGFRLPTDAEWEFACRANQNSIDHDNLSSLAWYQENSDGSTHPVGQKHANEFGLYDLLGNVWEWCWDLYDADVYGPYRIFRGGGWADEARSCLPSNRRRSHPTYAIDDLGFRVAL